MTQSFVVCTCKHMLTLHVGSFSGCQLNNEGVLVLLTSLKAAKRLQTLE